MSNLKDLFKEITPIDPPEPSPFDGYPVNFTAPGCAYFAGTTKCWFTAVTEYDQDELYLTLACDPPHPERHWLSYVMDTSGLDSALGLDFYNEEFMYGGMTEWLMRNGIAPEQRFIVEATFSSSRDYWGEYDEDVDWHVKDIEPWSPERVLEAWERYFMWRTGLRLRGLVVEALVHFGHQPDTEPKYEYKDTFKLSDWVAEAKETIKTADRWLP